MTILFISILFVSFPLIRGLITSTLPKNENPIPLIFSPKSMSFVTSLEIKLVEWKF